MKGDALKTAGDNDTDPVEGWDSGFPKWKIKKREYVLENPWIVVRQEDCRTIDDVDLGHYYLLEYPEWMHRDGKLRDESAEFQK